jgi:hypothetical protein
MCRELLETPLTKAQEECTQTIEKCSELMCALVDDVLNFSKVLASAPAFFLSNAQSISERVCTILLSIRWID